jgi:hypothetical protein
MDASNTIIAEYLLIPSAELAAARVSRLRMSNPIFLKATRRANLDAFYRLCAERSSAAVARSFGVKPRQKVSFEPRQSSGQDGEQKPRPK